MADADMMSIGEHCACSGCAQLDFLPFRCSGCRRLFCAEHRNSHGCAAATGSGAEVIVCPLCASAVRLVPGEAPDVTWERHTVGCWPALGLLSLGDFQHQNAWGRMMMMGMAEASRGGQHPCSPPPWPFVGNHSRPPPRATLPTTSACTRSRGARSATAARSSSLPTRTTARRRLGGGVGG